jgi:5'-nucleotidase
LRILLTNDDGIESPGLRLLQQALEAEHETWVVAPDSDRSGSSHSVTLKNPTKFKRLAEREYASAGTPADCALHACLGLVPGKIDMVVAGINLGPNLGTDIVYSGTAAAARQAAFMRTPSVACSLSAYQPPYHLEFPVEFMVRNLLTLRDLWSEDHFLNINFPNRKEPSQPVITIPTRRIYEDELVRFVSPQGDLYIFIGGQVPGSMKEEGSDFGAVEAGYASLSPIMIHPANHEVENRYREASFIWKSA